MPIVASDIKFLLSTRSGSAGHSVAQADPALSLGKYASTTLWAGGAPNDLFDDISGEENLGGIADYRCLFVWNSYGSLTLTDAKVWIPSQVSGGADVTIAVDSTAKSNLTDSAAQALEVSDENTAPAGLTFTAAASLGAALSLGNLLPGEVRAFWLRREPQNTAAMTGDGVTVRVTGETLP